MKEDRSFVVYIHTNKINHKKYIGITSKKPEIRWGSNGNGYKGQMFFKAIQKYGWDNFEHEIIYENITEEEAKGLERGLISKHKTNTSTGGYNLTGGGDGIFNPSQELRRQISERVSGDKNPMYGKTHTKQVRDKLSSLAKQRTGNKSPRYGKALTEQQRENIRVALINRYKCEKDVFYGKNSDLTLRQYLSEIAKERNNLYGNSNSKPVICNDIQFDTVKKCADYYNVKYITMIEWLIGKRGMPKNFVDMKLRYKGESFKFKQQYYRINGVTCDGYEFESLKSCSTYYNVPCTTMHAWLTGRCNMPKRFIDAKLRYSDTEFAHKGGINHGQKRKVMCENIEYNSVKECANKYKVNRTTMDNWLKGRVKMPKKYIKMGLSYLGENNIYEESIRYQKKVVCGSKVYNSIRDCANHHSVTESAMRTWLTCEAGMPDKFVSLKLRFEGDVFKSKKRGNVNGVICEERLFTTLKECANYYNANYSSLSSGLSGARKLPQKYIDLGLRYATEEDLLKFNYKANKAC